MTEEKPKPKLDLREYQVSSVEGLREAIRAGKKNLVLCSPTGSGKSIIALFLIDECFNKGRRAVFVCERIILVNQFSEILDKFGIPHGVIQGNHWRRRPGERIQIASAQTLKARGWPATDLIIVDECHIMQKDTLARIAERNCVTIGLTATPFAKGMGKFYDGIVNVTTTDKLTADGFLVPPKMWAPRAPDMEGVNVVAGEWVENETSERATRIVGDVVKEYADRGNNGKFIAFGVDVAHCVSLQAQFLSAGIRAELFTYKNEQEHETLMRSFKEPDSPIKGLISVSALSRGLDVPDVSVIILCRPLKNSFAEHIQILGRGLRPYPEKEFCTILDCAGNCARFMDQMEEFFSEGHHELDDGHKHEKKKPVKKEKEPTVCPQCSFVHRAAPNCPQCGFEYPKKNKIMHEAGTLAEIKRAGHTPGSGDLDDMQEFMGQLVCYWMCHNDECTNSGKKEWSKGWIYHKFIEKFKVPPPAHLNQETAHAITPAMRAWIKSRQIAWIKSQQRRAS